MSPTKIYPLKNEKISMRSFINGKKKNVLQWVILLGILLIALIARLSLMNDWLDLDEFVYEWLYYCPYGWPLK